jgi:hypothetical protein
MSTTAEEEKYPPRTKDEVANLDLTFITDAWGADMLRDAMNAVVLTQLDPEISKNKIDVWAYLATYEPPVGEGFMFCRDKVVNCVQANMQIGHSGGSMAHTMRHLELLIKIGLSKYREGYREGYAK